MIKIGLGQHPEEHIAFAVSPLLECVLSLHVLLDPKHHPLQHRWVRRMRTALPADVRRELKSFAFLFRTNIPDVFLPSADDDGNGFHEELKRLQRRPAELLLPALARPLYDHGGSGVLNEAVVAKQGGAHLLADPAAFAGQLAAFLERYWHRVFAAEWADHLDALLACALADSVHLMANDGSGRSLASSPPTAAPTRAPANF
jgi:Family of unknown function (DUF5937)